MDNWLVLSIIGDLLWAISCILFLITVIYDGLKWLSIPPITIILAGITGYLLSVIVRITVPVYPGQAFSFAMDMMGVIPFIILLTYVGVRKGKPVVWLEQVLLTSPFVFILAGIVCRAILLW